MKRIMIVASLFCIAAVFFGGDCDGKSSTPTAITQMQSDEENQKKLISSIPAPRLQTSLERKNLVRRLERVNRENMTSYVYLVSYGRVIAYHAVSGKVSSLNSYLTPMEQIIPVGNSTSNYDKTYVTIEAPDRDGSYGKNPDGIFFFTTEGTYVEWKGEYLWSDQPLKLTQQPELIQIISEKTRSSTLPVEKK